MKKEESARPKYSITAIDILQYDSIGRWLWRTAGQLLRLQVHEKFIFYDSFLCHYVAGPTITQLDISQLIRQFLGPFIYIVS